MYFKEIPTYFSDKLCIRQLCRRSNSLATLNNNLTIAFNLYSVEVQVRLNWAQYFLCNETWINFSLTIAYFSLSSRLERITIGLT